MPGFPEPAVIDEMAKAARRLTFERHLLEPVFCRGFCSYQFRCMIAEHYNLDADLVAQVLFSLPDGFWTGPLMDTPAGWADAAQVIAFTLGEFHALNFQVTIH